MIHEWEQKRVSQMSYDAKGWFHDSWNMTHTESYESYRMNFDPVMYVKDTVWVIKYDSWSISYETSEAHGLEPDEAIEAHGRRMTRMTQKFDDGYPEEKNEDSSNFPCCFFSCCRNWNTQFIIVKSGAKLFFRTLWKWIIVNSSKNGNFRPNTVAFAN